MLNLIITFLKPCKKKILFSTTFTLLLGCTSVGITKLQLTEVGKNVHCQYLYFFAGRDIKSGYQPLCDIDSRQTNMPWSTASREFTLKHAAKHQCQCGGDAVIIEGYSPNVIQAFLKLQVVQLANKNEKGLTYQEAIAYMKCLDKGFKYQYATKSCEIPLQRDLPTPYERRKRF